MIELGVYQDQAGEYKLVFNEQESIVELNHWDGGKWNVVDYWNGSYLCARLVTELDPDFENVHEPEEAINE